MNKETKNKHQIEAARRIFEKLKKLQNASPFDFGYIEGRVDQLLENNKA